MFEIFLLMQVVMRNRLQQTEGTAQALDKQVTELRLLNQQLQQDKVRLVYTSSSFPRVRRIYGHH